MIFLYFCKNLSALKNFIRILFLIFQFYSLFAQTPHSLRLNQTNGLLSNAVYDVLQDSRGFIWFATDAGLIRYDGDEYKPFYSKKQTSLGGSSIREDKMGRIWYENFDGYLYYVEKDSLQALNQNKPIAYLPISFTENHLFVMQNAGIDVFDIETLKYLQTIKIIPHIKIVENCISSHQDFFVIIDDIIYKIDKNFQIIKSSYFVEKSEDLKQVFYYQNRIYVLGRYNKLKTLWIFDTQLNFIDKLSIPEIKTSINYAHFIEKNLWIHTPQGTFQYTLKPNFSFERVYFQDKSISAVLKDRQNNFWFSTTNQGVLLVADLERLFFPLDNYLPYRVVSIGNEYLIASKKGELLRYDQNFKQKKIIKPLTDNTEIYFLHYDTLSKNIFFSSKGFTFLPKQDFSKKRFYELAIKDIVQIDEKYFAFAASGFCGLISFNDNYSGSVWDKNSIYTQVAPYTIIEIIKKSRGKAVAYNPTENIIYFATNIGLFRVGRHQVEELTFENQPFYASHLFFANKRLYALSTKGNFYLIENEKKLYQLNYLLGVKENEIQQAKKFGDYIYIITHKGLFVLNTLNQKIRIIDANINAVEINDFTVSQNYILLLSNEGITRISLLENKKDKISPKLQIRNFTAANLTRNFEEKIVLR